MNSDNNNEQFDSNEDFASMFEESINRSDNFSPGDKVEGVIVQINDENILVDISGKSEATIDIREFINSDGELTAKVNEKINAYVVSTSHGEIQLTSSIGKGFASSETLLIAFEQKIPVQGIVSSIQKGGYKIDISNVTCFCPFSQIDIKKSDDNEFHLNKKYEFKIIEYKNNGKNIVLSRRVLLEEERKKSEELLKDKLSIGDILEVTITKIAEFGVFADVGGLDGLIPRSELSLSRSVKPGDFKIGSKHTIKIIDLNWDDKKITLSIKQTMEDPWSNISSFKNKDSINGIITNTIAKGAFVEIIPGLEGFLPVSKMSYTKKINKPEDVVSIGDKVNVKILESDIENKKMLLELLSDGADPWLSINDEFSNKSHKAIIEAIKNSGLNVRLENGIEGFIPRSELSLDRNSDIQNAYSTGNEIVLSVVELNVNNRKLIGSQKQAKEIEENKEFSKHMKDNSSSENTSNLGSMFQNVFSDIKKSIKEDSK